MIDITTTITKIAFLMIFVIGFVIIKFMPLILSLWIGSIIPEYTAQFCTLAIVLILITSLSLPTETIIFATGKIRNYQIVISLILLLNFLLSWGVLSFGWSPISVIIIKCLVEVVVLLTRIGFVKAKIGYPFFKYLSQILTTSILFVGYIYIVMYLLDYLLSIEQTLQGMVSYVLLYIPIVATGCWFLYLKKNQRTKIMTFAKKRLLRSK